MKAKERGYSELNNRLETKDGENPSCPNWVDREITVRGGCMLWREEE